MTLQAHLSMKLLVSGATGFIGQHLIKRLLAEGHEICIVTRSASSSKLLKHGNTYVWDGDIEKLIRFLQTEHFAGVIHLASLFLAQHKPSDVAGLINSNLLFATTLLEAAVQSNIPWFINTGTFWQHFENQPYAPVNLYAATKQAFEDIAQYYIATAPINFVTLKLSDTFGPGDTRPKIFNLWMNISKTGETLDMSPGEQLIDISYIDNVIAGYLHLIQLVTTDTAQSLTGRSFALKSKERMSLKQLAGVFEKVTQTKLNINWGKKPYRPREVMVPWEQGETLPGFEPKVSLREGIKRTFYGQ